jgi:hypothetical protein
VKQEEEEGPGTAEKLRLLFMASSSRYTWKKSSSAPASAVTSPATKRYLFNESEIKRTRSADSNYGTFGSLRKQEGAFYVFHIPS